MISWCPWLQASCSGVQPGKQSAGESIGYGICQNLLLLLQFSCFRPRVLNHSSHKPASLRSSPEVKIHTRHIQLRSFHFAVNIYQNFFLFCLKIMFQCFCSFNPVVDARFIWCIVIGNVLDA